MPSISGQSVVERMRTCTKCGVEKPIDQFRVDRGHVRGDCRECERKFRLAYYAEHRERFAAASRKWSKTHPEQRNATKRAWYARNKEHQKRVVRLRMYGITADKYQELFTQQGGVCAVCRKPCITGRMLAVDHCHKTGKIRGLLCSPCNSALGFVKDDLTRLEALVSYLRSSS